MGDTKLLPTITLTTSRRKTERIRPLRTLDLTRLKLDFLTRLPSSRSPLLRPLPARSSSSRLTVPPVTITFDLRTRLRPLLPSRNLAFVQPTRLVVLSQTKRRIFLRLRSRRSCELPNWSNSARMMKKKSKIRRQFRSRARKVSLAFAHFVGSRTDW